MLACLIGFARLDLDAEHLYATGERDTRCNGAQWLQIMVSLKSATLSGACAPFRRRGSSVQLFGRQSL
jgi:hypothetical protein